MNSSNFKWYLLWLLVTLVIAFLIFKIVGTVSIGREAEGNIESLQLRFIDEIDKQIQESKNSLEFIKEQVNDLGMRPDQVRSFEEANQVHQIFLEQYLSVDMWIERISTIETS